MDQPAFDLEQIRAIIVLAGEADLAELTVESGALKVSVKRGTAAAAHASSAVRPAAAPAVREESPAAASENHYQPIAAPMVGTFYRSSNPESAPFVEEGDAVHPGQTVCIIEAMKLFNEIQAEVRGRVARVLAENGTPVEYGQPLFLIDPSADGA
ncbi:MAG TPA: acetyl-CoA carboxylase biotin carboxyl carrier protein [bacterium]